jgi:hypothetical protein
MLCTQCGNENPAGNRFCGECGAKLQAPVISEAERPVVSEPEAPVLGESQFGESQFSESQFSESQLSESAVTEAKSRPVGPKVDLRDPTDPGRIIVPANGRNATHVPADEPAPVLAEPPAHEVGETLDDAVVYRGNEQVYAEPVEPRHYMAAAGEFESAPPPRRDTSIHGPSLLGLSDDEFNSNAKDSGTTDYSYLYDDEGGGGGRTVNWRLMLALVVLIGFGGVLGYMWTQGKSWNTAIVRGGSQQKEAPPVVAKTEPTTPGAPEIAVGATQKPVPADEKPQSDATDATAKNNAAGANGTNAAKPTDNPPADANSSAGKPTDNPPADNATKNAGAAGAGAAGASAGDSKDAKTADSAKAAENKPSDDLDNKQATKKAAPADNAGDEEDAEAAAPAKPAKTTAAVTRAGKASAAKAARADNSDSDDIASVHRADALLKSHSCNQAVDLLREAALHGNATARSRLGGLYATGQCVPLDRAEAYNWFTLAKDAGAHYSWIEHNRSMLWAQMSERERERVMRR